MKVRRRTIGQHDAIEISGAFDADGEVCSLAGKMIEEGGSNIVLDLTRSLYLSSAALAAMVRIIKMLRSIDGTIEIRGASPDMVQFLSMVNIAGYLRIVP